MCEPLKPLLLGYLRLRISAAPAAGDAGRRLLEDFAGREGFALAEVFIDADENTPTAALAALIRYVRGLDVQLRGLAIAVPHLGHFGSNPQIQRQMCARLEREARVRVIVLQVQ